MTTSEPSNPASNPASNLGQPPGSNQSNVQLHDRPVQHAAIGGVTFVDTDGSSSSGAGSNKSLQQLMAEKDQREALLKLAASLPNRDPETAHFDPYTGISNETQTTMADAMTPLKADQFDIGPSSRFAMNLPDGVEGWDAESEQKARGWLEKAGANEGMAAGFTDAYSEMARADDHRREQMHTTSMSWLSDTYGNRSGEVIAAAQQLIMDTGGNELMAFLDQTNLGNHPVVIAQMCRLAELKGYYKK